MDFRSYQEAAARTSQLPLDIPKHAIAATFGLAHEAGSVANVYKKSLRDEIDPKVFKEILKVELGDLLWYASAVATAFQLNLQEIAEENLRITQDRYVRNSDGLRPFDEAYDAWEKFPRRLVFKFTDREDNGKRRASLELIEARPNAFPDGPYVINGHEVGFTLNAPFGASLTDNSWQVDGYRFHDAIHLGFLAVLGWSPVFRRLLQLKRRSNADVDEKEDGARAAFAEEGLSHVLARLSEQRRFFQHEESVDGMTLLVVKSATAGLEVNALPASLLTKSIVSGFTAMHSLIANEGGYLVADLDQRTLTHDNHYVPTGD